MGFRAEIHSDASARGRPQRDDGDVRKITTSTGESAAHSWITKQIKTGGQTVTFTKTASRLTPNVWQDELVGL